MALLAHAHRSYGSRFSSTALAITAMQTLAWQRTAELQFRLDIKFGEDMKNVLFGQMLGRLSLMTYQLLVSLIMFSAYGAQAENPTVEKINEKYFLLGLVGYNYTGRNISSYTVNGADGGHAFLSSPIAGGSGISCCIRLSKKIAGPIKVKVRWQVDGCIFLIKDDRTGKADRVRHYYYKEQEVDLQRVDGGTPGYIETHFYPDGSVQVQSTEHISSPRMQLDDKRPDQSSFSRCKDDKEPEE